MKADDAPVDLTGYTSVGDWLDRYAGPFFATRSSLDWFIKQHRRELVESDALITREGAQRLARLNREVLEGRGPHPAPPSNEQGGMSAPPKPHPLAENNVPTLSLAKEINNKHVRAQYAAQQAVQYAIDAGELLLQVKASLAHGEFTKWLATNIEFSERTAQGYMRLAQLDEQKRHAVADLTLRAALAKVATPAATRSLARPSAKHLAMAAKAEKKEARKKNKMIEREYHDGRNLFAQSLIEKTLRT